MMPDYVTATIGRVNMDGWPAMPPWAPHRSKSYHRLRVHQNVGLLAAAVKRELTQPEVDSLVDYLGKVEHRCAYSSDPALAAFVIYMARRVRKESTTARWWRNPLAFAGVQVFAFSVSRALFGRLLDRPFCLDIVSKTHEEEPLKTLVKEVTDTRQKEVQQRHEQAMKDRGAGGRPHLPTNSGDPPRSAGAPAQHQSFGASSGSQAPESWGRLPQYREEQDSAAAAASAAANAAASNQEEYSSPGNDGSLDPFDDASPVASSQPKTPKSGSSARARPSNAPGESAWDRIRRESGADQSTSDTAYGGGQDRQNGKSSWDRVRDRSQEARSGGSAWDRIRANTGAGDVGSVARGPPRGRQDGTTEDGSYSKEEADKAFARAQAQKEFDDMIEKERRAGSESSRGRWD